MSDVEGMVGGSAVATGHVHPLAGRADLKGNNRSLGKYASFTPSTKDKKAVGDVPMLVVTRNQATLVWTDDNRRVQHAVVLTFADKAALRNKQAKVVVPKKLRPKPPKPPKPAKKQRDEPSLRKKRLVALDCPAYCDKPEWME